MGETYCGWNTLDLLFGIFSGVWSDWLLVLTQTYPWIPYHGLSLKVSCLNPFNNNISCNNFWWHNMVIENRYVNNSIIDRIYSMAWILQNINDIIILQYVFMYQNWKVAYAILTCTYWCTFFNPPFLILWLWYKYHYRYFPLIINTTFLKHVQTLGFFND